MYFSVAVVVEHRLQQSTCSPDFLEQYFNLTKRKELIIVQILWLTGKGRSL
jgi:hypothetical protein